MPIDRRRILYQDQVLLAVHKLGGELVVKGKGRTDTLPLLDFLKKEFPSLVPIHRLDFETSGVVVLSKSRKILKQIVQSRFQGWKKRYTAIVLGVPKSDKGVIDFPLPARSGTGVTEAVTHYEVLEKYPRMSLISCEIERGQRHQIRRHLSMIGCPLILDEVYGNEKANRALRKLFKMHRFFLHAESVHFPHPVSAEMVHIQAERPKSFMMVVERLRGGGDGEGVRGFQGLQPRQG